MAKFKSTTKNGSVVYSLQNAPSGSSGWNAYEVIETDKLPDLFLSRELTDNSTYLYLDEEIPNESQLFLYQNDDNTVTYDVVHLGKENVFAGYICEFDYYNCPESQNILSSGLMNTSTWTTDTNTLPGNLDNTHVIITKAGIYLLGGYDGSNSVDTIYFAPINDDGTIGSWTTDSNTLPYAVDMGRVVVTKSRVYIIAGSQSGTILKSIIYADINADGTLGSWSIDTNEFPVTLYGMHSVVTKDRVYVFGGYDGSNYRNTVWYADIDSIGILSSWNTDSNTLPKNVHSGHAFITKSRVYLVGGYNTDGTLGDVFYADIASDGSIGAWSADSNLLPSGLRSGHLVVTQSRVYLLGGIVPSGSHTNSIYYADIDSNGYVGAWSTDSNTLSETVTHAVPVVTKYRVYLLGNRNDSGNTVDTIYYANMDGWEFHQNGYYTIYDKYDLSGVSLTGNIEKVFKITADIELDLYSTDTSNIKYSLDLEDSVEPTPHISNSEKIVVYNSTDGYKSVSNVSNTLYNINDIGDVFVGYPCEFDYHNKWHKQNILVTGIMDTSTWTTDSNTLPANQGSGQAIITSSRVYLISGDNDPDAIYYSNINSDGSLGAWFTDSNTLPVGHNWSQAVVTKSRVYLLGSDSPSNTINYADIDSNGYIGSWTTDSNTLPQSMGRFQAVVTKSRVYLLGGYDSPTAYDTVYYAEIDSNGHIGSWSTDSNTLPEPLYNSQSLRTKSRIYLIGGSNSSSQVDTIYYAEIDSNGHIGSWSIDSNTLPASVAQAQLVATQNRVYLLGGDTVSTIYYADIDSNGYIGAWSTDSNSLPTALTNSQAIVTKSRVYLIGGFNTNAIYYADMDGWEINQNGYYVEGNLHSVHTIDISSAGLTTSPTKAWIVRPRIHIDTDSSEDKANMLDIKMDIDSDSTTTSEVVTVEQELSTTERTIIKSTDNIQINSSTSDVSVVSVDELFPGGSREFNYHDKWHKHNMLKYGFVDTSSWSTYTNSLPGGLSISQGVVTDSYVYLFGGRNSSGETDVIYYAEIDNDGNIGAWTTDTNTLPTPLSHSAIVTTKSRVYLIGGYDGSNSVDTIFYAPINDDGTIGSWTTDSNTFPIVVHAEQTVVTKSRVYVIGGSDGTNVFNTVYYADIDDNGYIDTANWTLDSNLLPNYVALSQAIVTKSRVYLIGGYYNSALTYVYYSEIDNDGHLGPWSNGPSLPIGLFRHGTIMTKNRVYVIGGFGISDENIIYYSDIDDDGYLGSWIQDTYSLPGTRRDFVSVVTRNNAYILGGYDGSAHSSSILVTNADGWIISHNGYHVLGPVYKFTVPTQSTTPTTAVLIRPHNATSETVSNIVYNPTNETITISYSKQDLSVVKRSMMAKWFAADENDENISISVVLYSA